MIIPKAEREGKIKSRKMGNSKREKVIGNKTKKNVLRLAAPGIVFSVNVDTKIQVHNLIKSIKCSYNPESV